MCVFVSHPVSLTVVLPFAVVSSPMSNRKNNSQLLQRGQLLSTARCCARKRWPAAALGHWQHHDLSAPWDYQQGLHFRATTWAKEVSRETSVPSPHPQSPGAPVSAPPCRCKATLPNSPHTLSDPVTPPPFSPLRNSRQRWPLQSGPAPCSAPSPNPPPSSFPSHCPCPCPLT